jgi:hypothetical protein
MMLTRLVCRWFLLVGALAGGWKVAASDALPFDPGMVSRLSVDGRPRSLAVRQGGDVWLAYDLERALVFKVWRSPKGKPGLVASGFTTKSSGSALHEAADTDAKDDWRLVSSGGESVLKVRYLGCSHREGRVGLRWELRAGETALTLHEVVPQRVKSADGAVRREWRVEGLAAGQALRPPDEVLNGWRLKAEGGKSGVSEVGNEVRHFLFLP